MKKIRQKIITLSIIAISFFICSLNGISDAVTLKDLDEFGKSKLGEGDAYICTDYVIDFGGHQIIQHSQEGNGYLPDIPKNMKINGNIYVVYQKNIYVSKIIGYRFERIMNKYNILIIKASGETVVPVNFKPSQLINAIDGIDITEIIKHVSKRAVYETHTLDNQYRKLSANAQNEFFEFILFFQVHPLLLLK